MSDICNGRFMLTPQCAVELVQEENNKIQKHDKAIDGVGCEVISFIFF